MQPYDNHASRVKSSWNYVNFFLESSRNSLNLDLGKMCEPFNSFLAKVRERQETWVSKSQGKSRTLAKQIGWNSRPTLRQAYHNVLSFAHCCFLIYINDISESLTTNVKLSGDNVPAFFCNWWYKSFNN